MLPKLVKAFSGARRARLFAAALLLALGAATDASAQTSKEKAAAIRRNSPFNLQAAATQVLQANLVQCGLDNNGNVCTDIFNSPTGGGGFWPSGTANQYIFNSGLQIAGINSAGAGPLAGDTVGAYFFDARGQQAHGSALSQIFNSLNAADLANWPATAVIADTTLFNPALVGQQAISDQDTYVRYWDGDPNKLGGGRRHPMGITVEQRSLAFNAPAGAENTLFFIYRFKNVTNTPEFQIPNEQQQSLNLPDAGWRIDSIYAAFAMDPDVTSNGAGANFSTAVLPFNLAMAYKDDFTAPEFNFNARADLYAPPFFVGPGFVGVKYLRSPINPATGQQVGLTMFTNTTNTGGAFLDPLGVKQLWRYLSGNVSSAKGDPVCNIPNAKERRLCALVQDPADTRFVMASGPFSLNAGQEAIIVVAYTHGAPVSLAGYNPGTILRPGIPSVTPGVAGEPIRDIERIAGMVNVPADAVVNGQIDQTRVQVTPRSLLANALVAQTIFNNKFLLPRPPEAPSFALVPGNDQVTVVWQPSRTNTAGDPYYPIAANTASALYDPNYRQFDVEGYRVYRATGLSGAFELIAEFDATGTTLNDFTGAFDERFVPTAAGVAAVAEEYRAFLEALHEEYPRHVALSGAVSQFPDGSRFTTTPTGAIVITNRETRNFPDTGIPFAFLDRDVRNGITYRYAVTAFDVNSLASGAFSLESPRLPQPIVPRTQPLNQVVATFTSSVQGDNATALNPDAPLPTIDANTGVFSGPMPPTNGITSSFAPLVPQLLPAFKLTATIDSVLPSSEDVGGCPLGSNAFGGCWRAYLSFDRNGVRSQSVANGYTPTWSGFGEAASTDFTLGSGIVPADTTARRQFGLPAGFAGFSALVDGHFEENVYNVSAEGYLYNRRIGLCNTNPNDTACTTRMHGGMRWFTGATETVADPTTYIRVGHLTGVDTIWAPIGHTPQSPTTTAIMGGSTCMQTFGYGVGALSRAADIRFTWGANTFSAVRDVVHNVNLRFNPGAQAGTWGFLTTDYDGNGVVDYTDFLYLPEFAGGTPALNLCGGDYTPTGALTQTMSLVPVSVSGSAEGAAKPVAGQGFGLYVDGNVYIFVMSAAPASATVWTLRKYQGEVRTNAVASLDANGYRFVSHDRPPLIPGLKVVFESASPTVLVGDADLTNVHTVPDPYYVRSDYELGPNTKQLLFQNLPPQGIVRIFSVDGTLVRVLEHNDPMGGGQLAWDLRNRNDQFVATGVYFYVVETADGQKKTGKFTVLQFVR